MKFAKLIALFAAACVSTSVAAEMANSEYISNGGLESLRGATELNVEDDPAPLHNPPRDGNSVDRNYVHQPPLIPHQVRDYQVDINSNKCLSCHAWSQTKESQAVRVGVTHFVDRDGITLSDVSPSRYFCMQCHVTQVEDDPLVKSSFDPAGSLLAK